MRYLLLLILCVCDAQGTRVIVKNDIQRLTACVVDVVVSEKNSASDGNVDKKETTNGSGFIIDENGYIATNAHVIGDYRNRLITVRLADGGEYAARVVGTDERSDIALLKIDGSTKHPCVVFADSDKVEVGEAVIAIGNPFGFGKTVTSGIVSYKGRNLSEQIAELGAGGDLVSYLQTDAAVSQGSSGGPLFTNEGKVVGMIMVFLSDGIQCVGINFAIPSNTLKKVVKELKDHGRMQRSWLGISVSPLSKKAARALGLNKQHGCAITKVEENSPAAAAGVLSGDILTSVNDEDIVEGTDFELILSSLPIGKVIPIQVVRHGTETKLSVMVGILNDVSFGGINDTRERKDIPREEINGLGICVAELTPDLRKRFDIPDNVTGVIISSVENFSANNIAVGNIILSVNQTHITSTADLKAVLLRLTSAKKNRELAFFIYDPQIRKYQYVVLEPNRE